MIPYHILRAAAIGNMRRNGIPISGPEKRASQMAESKIKPRLAYFTLGCAGYGNRLFIPASFEVAPEDADSSMEAHDILKKRSCWGGYDKRWEVNGVVHFGYEFGKDGWDDTLSQLGEAGFTFKQYSVRDKVDDDITAF